ncbi:MAG: magnesium transporter CorA family protein [Spirochaetaceae bacterium]|jgi:magnesium transporter|nr:magnesium transporter CorA family protein [Spirochaetaceae bacterium]
MITIWTQQEGRLVKQENADRADQRNIWVDARDVTREDIRILEEEYGVSQEHILDILDQDELSRIEKEDEYTLIIARLPVYIASDDVSYFTIPLGIVLYPGMLITICWTDCEVLKDIALNRIKGLSLKDFPAFIIRLLSRADTIFLRYLKEINRRSTVIQKELQLSIKNKELIKLQNLEKSLVFFTTSLKSNQLLLEKLAKTRILRLDEEDRDWLEDAEIDNRQAIEMADTYSNIISGMSDAFASVISNNLNSVMKRLTVISLILMIPTFITSFFGMNIPLPFSDSGWLGVGVLILACGCSSIIAAILLREKHQKSKRDEPTRRGRPRKMLSGKSR